MEKRKRPAELSQFLEDTSKDNDTLITEALEKLKDPLRRGKLKPTVATIIELTGLSRNTIRNRVWALSRLKDIKAEIRAKKDEKSTHAEPDGEEKSVEDLLRDKVKVLTEQNVSLYNEVLNLQEANARLCNEMEELQRIRLRVV